MRISETINYIAPVRLSFLLSAWYKLKSPGKIECQWKNGLHQFVLRTCLGGIVLTDDWYVCVLQRPQRHEGQGFKRKLAEQDRGRAPVNNFLNGFCLVVAWSSALASIRNWLWPGSMSQITSFLLKLHLVMVFITTSGRTIWEWQWLGTNMDKHLKNQTYFQGTDFQSTDYRKAAMNENSQAQKSLFSTPGLPCWALWV